MLHMINTTPILNETLEAEYFCKSSYTLPLSIKVIKNCESQPIMRMLRTSTNGLDYFLGQRLLRHVVLSRTWAKKYEY